MANICTNILVMTNIYENEASTKQFIEEMKKFFDCYCVDEGEEEVEIWFSSKFCFPDEILKEITGNIVEFKACIDVISYEFNVDYAAYHKFMNGEWINVWSGETI